MSMAERTLGKAGVRVAVGKHLDVLLDHAHHKIPSRFCQTHGSRFISIIISLPLLLEARAGIYAIDQKSSTFVLTSVIPTRVWLGYSGL